MHFFILRDDKSPLKFHKMQLMILIGSKRSGVGVCLALRTLVRKVKRTLAIVGSWIGCTTITVDKTRVNSRAPQQKSGLPAVLCLAVRNVYTVCTTDEV